MKISTYLRRGGEHGLTLMAAQAVVRLTSSFVIIKLIAVYLVPAQFLIYGQLQTLMQIYSAFVSSVASTKFSAIVAKQYGSNQEQRVTNTAVFLVLILTFILALIAVVFDTQIRGLVGLDENQLSTLFLPIGACAVAYTTLLQAYFTGTGSASRFGKSVMLSVIAGSTCTVVLTIAFGFKGAIFSVGCSPVFAYCIVTFSDNPVFKRINYKNIDFVVGKEIFGFGAASIAVLVGYYCIQIYIRSHYASAISEHAAGLFIASARLSDVYMGVLAVIFANLLTRYYRATDHKDALSRILRGYAVCAVVLAPAFLLLIVSVNAWLPIVLNNHYSEAGGHITWQMIADFWKCLYWVAIYYVIAKCSTYVYLFLESAGLILYLLLAHLNPFNSAAFWPQIAQILEYSILLLMLHIFLAFKRNV